MPTHMIYPAHAGINLHRTTMKGWCPNLPRTRGDKPVSVFVRQRPLRIYPVRAGINPLYQFTIDAESSTPHTRG